MTKFKTPDGKKLAKESVENMYMENNKFFILTSYESQRDLDGVSCFLVKKEDVCWEKFKEEINNFFKEYEYLESDKKLDKKNSIGFILDENGKVDVNDSAPCEESVEDEEECLPLILDCPNPECNARIYDLSKGIPYGFAIPETIECPICGEVALQLNISEEEEEDE